MTRAATDPDDLLVLREPEASEARLTALLERHADAPAPWKAAVRTMIARTYSLRQLFDEALARLDEIERGEGGDAPEVRVRLLLERGRCANSSGDPAGARALFERAWMLAGEHAIEALALDAAHMVAITLSGTPEGIAWNERALAVADKADDPRLRRWLGPLLNNLAWDRFERGEPDAALALFERSLAFRVDEGKAGPIRIARWSLARCWRELGRLDVALATQRELLVDHPSAQPDPGMIHEELGECLLALSRPDEATPHFREAAALLTKDDWLREHEPERLARLTRLGQGAAG